MPRQAMAEWANHGAALLPLGARFDAVRVPASRIHAAVGSDEPSVVAGTLGEWLHGPVIRDTRTGQGTYYVLVALDAEWAGAEDRLGAGTYLAVPCVGEQVSPVTYWVVRPFRRGGLCDTAHLAALLAVAGTVEREAGR
ncbi:MULTISPECIES: hypothetical protein [Streptomyces]|uniref:hypothetical protein n=1 Tax=Streptomyces TaxID=1883 RepID=UPI001F030F29|nr:hypothetical protein [Streptomyces alboflavus]